MPETIHLVQNSDPYGDTEVWCGEEFTVRYATMVSDATCKPCLETLVQEGHAASQRLADLSTERR